MRTTELASAREGVVHGWLLVFLVPFLLAAVALTLRVSYGWWTGHPWPRMAIVAGGWDLALALAAWVLTTRALTQRALLRPERRVGSVRSAHLSARQKGNRYLTLAYAFAGAAGQELAGVCVVLRPDLAEADLPAPGTQVGIAYASERVHTAI